MPHGGNMDSANRLYFGDCLDVMREFIPDESVDCIYADPPFNSKRLYNAFIGGAQYVAFDDTWQWYEAVGDFQEVAQQPAYRGLMEGLRTMLGEGPQLAYLSYMANRLLECRRVLKPTGSIYLHCDPTMSHYLKAVMDGIFVGGGEFRNEIIWLRRQDKHNLGVRQMGRAHDVILWYAKTHAAHYNIQYLPYSSDYLKKAYNKRDKRGVYRTLPCTNESGGNKPYEFRGITRAWRFSPENMERLYRDGMLVQATPTSPYQYKKYLDTAAGVKLQDLWADIPGARGNEHLGYATQKPVALVERIWNASTNEGDTVLDPFCGCGTAIHAAQNLGRRWIGIDICVNACKVIEQRLKGHFDSLWNEVEFVGMPKTRDDAQFMAGSDPFRFERWAASLVDGMEANRKQRGDGGIDGWGRLAVRKGQFVDLVSQVKGGHTNPGHVQAFNGARQQAGADLGIFTCFEDRVTVGMRNAAIGPGYFRDTQVPVIQIYTIEDYFEGRKPAMPVAV